jgi:serine/threonine-protein kinase HipA
MSEIVKLGVRLGEAGIEIGTLVFESRLGRESSTFRYAASWLENPAAFAISPSMPLGHTPYRGRHSRDVLYPFAAPIADQCPDSWGREIARLSYPREKGSITGLDYLTGIDDKVRIGALRYADESGKYLQTSDYGHDFKSGISINLKELALSARAIENRTPTTIDIRRLRGIGSAFGGARPKASITDEKGNLYVAKFSSKAERLATEKMEVATHWLARLVGIKACEAQVVTSRDFDPVALIKRFDRTSMGKRIPYISARTMLDTESAVGSTYTEIGYAIRAYGNNPADQLHELFRRVAFTILVSNVDDHLLNHGFLGCRDGKWTLAPMFDVNPAPERANTMKTAISEISGNEASIEALLEVAAEFDLTRETGSSIIGDMAHLISGNWKKSAQSAGMTTTEIKAYTDAFDHKESAFALNLQKSTVPGPPENITTSTAEPDFSAK